MPRNARFYFSRVLKGGRLETELIAEGLSSADPIQQRQFAWTFVDYSQHDVRYRRERYAYHTALLAKYDPRAVVEVVDETHRRLVLQPEPNLQRATSAFVYLPAFRAVCHRHVWNEITPSTFRDRFAEIILSHFRQFFVTCQLDPIVDLDKFINRLRSLDDVTSIKATVSPPNPLFSPLWRSLRDYLEHRRARQIRLNESAEPGQSLNSRLVEIAESSLGRADDEEVNVPADPPDLTDASVLMAVDGYGTAEVTGRSEGATHVIKTRNNALQIQVPADASHEEIANAAVRTLVQMNVERQLEH